MGYRAGEQTQVVALAQALGWPFEIKELTHTRIDFVPGLLRRKSLSGIKRGDRSELSPPWPDLIISAGMRNEPICRWIKQASGGMTKLVHIGRPWAPLEYFDLVVTTPQYRLPQRPNVLENLRTLHSVSETTLSPAAKTLAPRLVGYPCPYLGVIVGGNSGPYTFGPHNAHRLALAVNRMVAEHGGTALVSTSSRTSRRAADALADALTVPTYFYRWGDTVQDNPYLGILALADRLIVTSDSVSMLSEAVATGKPVYIFDLAVRREDRKVDQARHFPYRSRYFHDFRLGALLYRLLMHTGPRRLSRDLTLFHRGLTNQGLAQWIGQNTTQRTTSPPDDLARAVRRVRQLLATSH
jgi:mitochondrial fission protein ELM1